MPRPRWRAFRIQVRITIQRKSQIGPETVAAARIQQTALFDLGAGVTQRLQMRAQASSRSIADAHALDHLSGMNATLVEIGPRFRRARQLLLIEPGRFFQRRQVA